MLADADHVFTDAIGALRDAFENALLERQAFEERFQADVLLGDLTWETSYGLPGEGSPPRVQADITLNWPTWAQTAYRSWYIGEPFEEGPRIEIEIVLRLQRLAQAPDPGSVLAVLPENSPPDRRRAARTLGPHRRDRVRRGPVRGRVRHRGVVRGRYELDEATLKDGSTLDDHFSAMGGWIASTLVRLGDLKFEFLPPDEGRGRGPLIGELEVSAPSGYELAEAPRADGRGGVYFSDALGGGRVPLGRGSLTTIVPKRRGVGGMALHADGGVVVGGRAVVHVAPDGTNRDVWVLPEGIVGVNDLCALADGTLLVGALRFLPFGGDEPVPGLLLPGDPARRRDAGGRRRPLVQRLRPVIRPGRRSTAATTTAASCSPARIDGDAPQRILATVPGERGRRLGGRRGRRHLDRAAASAAARAAHAGRSRRLHRRTWA